MVQSYVNDVLVGLFESTVMDDGNGGKESLFHINSKGEYEDINYEFEPFTRPSYGVWYELHFIPSQPLMAEIGHSAMNEWSGIFQINICVLKTIRTITPQFGVKDYVDNAYASIAEVMKRGVIKDRVHITGIGISSAIDNGDYYAVPISVSWYANLAN